MGSKRFYKLWGFGYGNFSLWEGRSLGRVESGNDLGIMGKVGNKRSFDMQSQVRVQHFALTWRVQEK